MQQSYSGAHSDFIVAFTRLAYAEAPEWLPPEDAGRIDGLTGEFLVSSSPQWVADCEQSWLMTC